MTALRENYETEWRVTEDDLWQHREYKVFRETYDEFMEQTEKTVKWHVLDGDKKRQAARDALKLLVEMIDKGLENGRYVGKPFSEKFPLLKMQKLSEVDLSPALDDEEYRKELKKLQKRLGELHNTIYRKKIPVILCYEGWDAAGKGGNIRRIARPLDPRGFDVMPIASPEPHELNRQYLWRFWTRLPRSGHVCIFDRTWYGRVMVERLEGFCSEDDWKRAFNEMNEFERQLTDWGAVVIKFWMIRTHSWPASMTGRTHRKNSGSSRKRTGATERNGRSMKRPLTRCSRKQARRMPPGTSSNPTTRNMPASRR